MHANTTRTSSPQALSASTRLRLGLMGVSLGLAIGLIGLVPASAAPPRVASVTTGDVPTARVRIDDLNLATPRGQARLQQRVRAAVHEVCGRPQSSRPGQAGRIADCHTIARAGVERQLQDLGLPAIRAASRD